MSPAGLFCVPLFARVDSGGQWSSVVHSGALCGLSGAQWGSVVRGGALCGLMWTEGAEGKKDETPLTDP